MVIRKTPLLSEPEAVSLINLDPAAAARSIDRIVAEANDEKDWLEEKIWVEFYNVEEPGHSQYFCYGRCDDPQSLTLEHGERKELTRGQIRFIESRQTPIYEYRQQGFHKNGLPKMKKQLVGWKPRFQCRQINERRRNS